MKLLPFLRLKLKIKRLKIHQCRDQTNKEDDNKKSFGYNFINQEIWMEFIVIIQKIIITMLKEDVKIIK